MNLCKSLLVKTEYMLVLMIILLLLIPFVFANASPIRDFNYKFNNNNNLTYTINIRNFYDIETTMSILVEIKEPSTKYIVAVDSFDLYLDEMQERRQSRTISSIPEKDYLMKIKIVGNDDNMINSDDEFILSQAKKYIFDKNTVNASAEQKFNTSNQEFNVEDLSCTPDYCSNGLSEKSYYCNAYGCYRTCEANICKQQWNQIYSSSQSWNDESEWGWSNGFGGSLGQYTNFQTGKCYQVNTWSDNGVIDNSDIDNYVSDNNFDSAFGLYWELENSNNVNFISPWGQACYLNDDGNLMDEKYHYLIDDNDDGDDFNSADSIGGSWTGYCSSSCNDVPGPCTTKCYGSQWDFRYTLDPDVDNSYSSLNPTSSKGACNAESGDDPKIQEIDYVDFNNNDYAGITVWESPVEFKSETKSCQCDYGSCCENKKFKSSWSQPTGYTDYYYLSGDNSALTTKTCVLKDFQCPGNNQEFVVNENTKQTCGKCQYCTSEGCKNYAQGTNCGNNMVCNANG